MTPEEKQQLFHKELKELLIKFDAYLIVEDFGKGYSHDYKMVAEFNYDESMAKTNDTGVVPNLLIGSYEDGKH